MGGRCCSKGCSMASTIDDVKSPQFWRAVVAEFVGTLFLVMAAVGSCLPWEDGYDPSIVQIALAIGIMVATMVWCIGHVSGGHINPAVTIPLLVTRKISVARAALYIIAQCLGAMVGAGIVKGLTPGQFQGSLGCTTVHPDLSPQQGFGMEFMLTFVLVFTVFASCDTKRTDLKGSAPLTIGLAVVVTHLYGIKFTGSSINPARSFGPAVVANIWHEHWVYWCGPLLGGTVAGLLYENVFATNASVSKAKGYLLAADYNPDDYDDNPEVMHKVVEMEASV